MQLIKRLQCLAFAAIALAFAQLPALAADPGIGAGDMRYSLNGGLSWSSYDSATTWQDVIDGFRTACGDKPISGYTYAGDAPLVGGTSKDNCVTVIVQNVYFVCSDQLVGRVDVSGPEWDRKYVPLLMKGTDRLHYVSFRFENCTFSHDSENQKSFCFGANENDGTQLQFVSCDFIDAEAEGDGTVYSSTVYGITHDGLGHCNVDLYYDNCRAKVMGCGQCAGDFTSIGCTVAQVNINGHHDADGLWGKNSFNEESTFILRDFTVIDPVSAVVSWGCSFKHYYISNVNTDGYAYRLSGWNEWGNEGTLKFGPVGGESGAIEAHNKDWPANPPPALNLQRIGPGVAVVLPMNVIYDANGGNGTLPDPIFGAPLDLFTPADGSSLNKKGGSFLSWNSTAAGDGTKYEAGVESAIPYSSTTIVTLYAQYGEAPREPTGQYRISCLTKNTSRTVESYGGLEEGTDENGNAILYKDYPWYSDENWMTNVYDTVKTVWGNGSSTDPLTVTVWGKETTPDSGVREPLLLGDGDMTTEKILEGGFTGASCLYNDSTIVWTTFVFDNCIWPESGVKTGDDKCGRYVIYETAGGVDFVFKDGIMTNSVSTYECELTYNVGLTFDGVRFEKTCGYIQYFAANVDFRNCTFAAGYYNKIVQAKYEGWFDEWETSGGNSSDTSDDALAAYTNNIWEAVSPGQWLVQFGNYDYAQFGDSKICTDATGFTGLHVDMKVYDGTWDEKPDDDQTKTNETFVAYDQCGVDNYRRQVRVVVHPVTVKFIQDAGAEITFYAVVGLSDLWTSTGDNYRGSDATVDDFPDVSTLGNLWYEESDPTTGYTLDELKTKFSGPFEKDLTFVEGEPIEPELVGTLKMSSFVKGHEPTTPSGLSWRVGENGTLYPLLVGEGKEPTTDECEYYIFSDPNETDVKKGIPATLDNLKELDAGDGAGKDYYIRGIVTDFSEEGLTHAPLVSAPAKFTVVNPEHGDYEDFMFVDWIETTGCQYLDTGVDPEKNGNLSFGFAVDFVDDCYGPKTPDVDVENAVLGSSKPDSYNWMGLFLCNNNVTSGSETRRGQFNFCTRPPDVGVGWIDPCLTNTIRIQICFTNCNYSISSSELKGYGLDETLVSTYTGHFRGTVCLAGVRTQPAKERIEGHNSNHNMHFYGLRLYNGTELIYEGIPAIDKTTGHRGLLKINGDVGDTFAYTRSYTNQWEYTLPSGDELGIHESGYVLATNACGGAETVGAMHEKPLGINEFNTTLINLEDHLAQNCGCFEVEAGGDLAEKIDVKVRARLLQYEGSSTVGPEFIGPKGMTNAAYTVLYASAELDGEKDWTNTVVNAYLAKDADATFANGTLELFKNWSATPPANADTFKVVVLTAVSKPVVRTVTVMRGITVTLNANGGKYGDGEETAKLEAKPGEPMAELADVQIPTRVDEDGNEYTFIGYFDKSGEQYYDKDGKPTKEKYPETDIDLYAHWVNSEYDVIGYLQNWDPVKPDSRAGYVDLGENVHLSGDNLVGLKYCLETNDVAYQNIFMTRTKNDNKYTEYGLVWSKNPNPGIKFHYVKETTDTYNSGMWTADDKACATEADLSVWLDGAANGGNCLLDGEPYKWDSGNITLFDSEIEQKILLFVADNQDACDGTPEVMTDAAESNRINYCMIGKMYYFKVLDSADNRELKLDLVPVTNKTTGVRGFYDTLTEAFYPLRMPIQLHYENGTGNSEYVYSVKGEELPAVTPPKYAGHVFLGYFDKEGTKYYDADGKGVLENPYTEAADLYARWKLACPLELFIAAHAHTADVDSKQYVYLAVQPSFATALTDAAFSTWLDEAKAGNAFKVCVSDDGETFSDAIEVTLDDSGAHKYDADKAKGWMWMKVDISAAKDAGKKYWKAMFVTPEPAQPAPESAD